MIGSPDDSAPEAGRDHDDQPHLLVFMESGENRSLLVGTLGNHYRTETTTDPDRLTGRFDLCVLGQNQFARVAERVKRRREESDVFVPFLLLAGPEQSTSPAAFEYVEDVVELPVGKAELLARVGNLVERRLTARRLAERESELEATVEELRRKEKAIDEAPVGFVLSDPDREDNPLVYVNEQFERQTGYGAPEAVGRNCRFLQGEETDPRTRERLRAAIDAGRPVSVDIVNYRKDGRKFWNKLDVAPVRDETGAVTNYVGFQTDITDRKIRERRTEVLNRVLSHNLRNKMNVIEVYVDMLREEFDDPPEAIEKIETAAADLLRLAETVRETDRILTEDGTDSQPVDLATELTQMMSGLRDRYPDARFELSVPDREDGELTVAVAGLSDALEEAIENAVKHNDDPEPTVAVRVAGREDGWIDIEVADDGPGIPDQETEVLRTGEAALRHADRMGIWLIYWTVSRAGGSLSIEEGEEAGTVLSISVPTARGRTD